MTDPIQDAFNKILVPGKAWSPIEQLEEAKGLLRQAKMEMEKLRMSAEVEIEKLRLSVDGERRVKLQYKNEAEALMEVNASLHRKLLNKPDWKLVLWLGGCIGCIVGSCVTLFFL